MKDACAELARRFSDENAELERQLEQINVHLSEKVERLDDKCKRQFTDLDKKFTERTSITAERVKNSTRHSNATMKPSLSCAVK